MYNQGLPKTKINLVHDEKAKYCGTIDSTTLKNTILCKDITLASRVTLSIPRQWDEYKLFEIEVYVSKGGELFDTLPILKKLSFQVVVEKTNKPVNVVVS